MDDDVDVWRPFALMIAVTPLIITFNEKENIGRVLAALNWAEQVLLIDSFSDDGTIDLARQAHRGVRVVQRQFTSFADQCNFGLTQISTEWVLSLDADYIINPNLADEIKSLQPPSGIAGYSVEFRYCVFGRALRNTVYPHRTVLHRKENAIYQNEGHGHRVSVQGPVERLKNKINHDDRKPLHRWLKAQNDYMLLEARHLLQAPVNELNWQDRLRRQIYFAPPAIFLYLLFMRGLVLDGWRGWFYVCQRTLAEMLLSIRLLIERERVEPDDAIE